MAAPDPSGHRCAPAVSGEPPNSPASPDGETAAAGGYRARRLIGLGIGWGLTLSWIAYVLLRTRADPSQPLFDYIFIVPLSGWIAAFVMRHVVNAVSTRKTPPVDRI